ncbi:hypothetical protein ACQW02_01235 [Humitalea sp. 24SJ18S-53]|uniref:hypothetical protein n=1 Tax=Humitalea sp. 24SJ18S-53 TaxID=3422307 RepID=UPI003D664C6B
MSLLTQWRRLPQLVRFMALNGVLGFGIAALFVAGLLAANPGDARNLLLAAAGHWWPAAVLWFFLGLTFGGVQMGVAVMLLAERPAPPKSGHPAPLVPVRVAAGRRR